MLFVKSSRVLAKKRNNTSQLFCLIGEFFDLYKTENLHANDVSLAYRFLRRSRIAQRSTRRALHWPLRTIFGCTQYFISFCATQKRSDIHGVVFWKLRSHYSDPAWVIKCSKRNNYWRDCTMSKENTTSLIHSSTYDNLHRWIMLLGCILRLYIVVLVFLILLAMLHYLTGTIAHFERQDFEPFETNDGYLGDRSLVRRHEN